MIKAKVISIGDELLLGHIVNGNAAYIAERLQTAGVSTKRIVTIGDTEQELTNELNDSLENFDVTVLTGGLGPTHDDITKPILVKFFNDKLVTDEKTLGHIKNIFLKREMQMPEINKEQALVPSKAKILFNNFGTAPGIWIEEKNKIFAALPGVPYEMKFLMEDSVIPMLKEKFSNLNKEYYNYRHIYTIGISESGLFELLGDIKSIAGEKNKIAFLPSGTGVKLRLDAYGKDKNIVEKELVQMENKIRSIADKYIYGIGDDTLELIIGKMLKDKSLSLSAAESCTGGLISAKIVSINGSSKYYMGGSCTYSNDAKENILGVKRETLKKFGAVSEECAIEMAEGIKKAFNTDIGISTTGIAGPEGGSDKKPVGLVWIGYSSKNKSFAKRFLFGNERSRNIERAASAALNLLREQLNLEN